MSLAIHRHVGKGCWAAAALVGAALVASFPSTASAQGNNKTGARADSVIGIPAPAPGTGGVTPTPIRQTPTGSVRNFYGDSPSDTFSNTATHPGPPSTRQVYGTAPAGTATDNPNNTAALATQPLSNGTGQPLQQQTPIVTPPESTGAVDNPQESTTALIWITVFGILVLGSVWGLIHYTQPGGQV